MNPELRQRLIDALNRRIEIIADEQLRVNHPEKQLLLLRNVSSELDLLQRELPAGTDPQLRHFFEQCSYSKALAWLQSEQVT
jgi:hypothetical protein